MMSTKVKMIMNPLIGRHYLRPDDDTTYCGVKVETEKCYLVDYNDIVVGVGCDACRQGMGMQQVAIKMGMDDSD